MRMPLRIYVWHNKVRARVDATCGPGSMPDLTATCCCCHAAHTASARARTTSIHTQHFSKGSTRPTCITLYYYSRMNTWCDEKPAGSGERAPRRPATGRRRPQRNACLRNKSGTAG